METLIRLATAHAKARLSVKVEQQDAKQAEEIMRFALFKEVPKRQRRKKRKLNNGAAVRKGVDDGEGSDEESGGEETGDDEPAPERMSMPPASPKTTGTTAVQDPVWGDESQDVTMVASSSGSAAASEKMNPER